MSLKVNARIPAAFYVHAALFDCDGTLVNSTGAISEFWREFAKTRPHVDAEEIIKTSHGCRTYDVIAKWSPDDAEEKQVSEWEGSIPDSFGQFARPIPGAVELVKKFDEISRAETDNKHQRWAIITSGTLPLASKWLKLLELEKPECFITAERVSSGKPDPQGYLAARRDLGYDAPHARVVVFEDAPSGIKAGKDAGAIIVGICSTYDAEKVKSSGADIAVKDLSSFEIEGYNPATDEFKVVVKDYLYAREEFTTRRKSIVEGLA
ncbi:Piso0_005714 [Millerozyma farinosa CBS 7064]|uniref:Piso0_005714 protein n=1 Tax=Pichia sorbitophila (strain ATCC MYA-4447 / BCRC 22081 / CBS 7064 / NBRC 10061 / NRRL Y-12695) TaxID=559304 RepID=G8Y2Q4_PICSO|nr:Piso0_005714 [Millerozyma farinosa CBS 7064]